MSSYIMRLFGCKGTKKFPYMQIIQGIFCHLRDFRHKKSTHSWSALILQHMPHALGQIAFTA
jgi:hypothetical protein